MAGTDPLLVLVLEDAVLRSTLVARLALGGATVLTARHFDERLPKSAGATPAVLVTEPASLAGHPGGAEALLEKPRWSRLVVLGTPPAPPLEDARLFHLDPADASSTLPRLLAKWR